MCVTHASAFVQTNVDGAFELHVRGLGKLERPEFGCQKVAVHRVEVLEQIRVHRTTAKHMYRVCIARTDRRLGVDPGWPYDAIRRTKRKTSSS